MQHEGATVHRLIHVIHVVRNNSDQPFQLQAGRVGESHLPPSTQQHDITQQLRVGGSISVVYIKEFDMGVRGNSN